MNEIKILHTGDIQVEVRDHQQRYDEFEYLFSQIENIATIQKPDIYLIAGDVFEFNKPNDIERLLVINHLRKMLELQFIKEIVITHGNHDIDQRKFVNFFKSNGEDVPTCNALDSIVFALNNNRISLLNESTYYRSKMQENLVWINWSQKVKHSNIFEQSYNPLLNIPNVNELLSNNICITLYHDPIKGAKQWDSKLIHGSEKSNSLNVFQTHTILAGDIHIPQVIEEKYQKFVYCGSPIARDFGEGDYYKNGRITCENNTRHTVNVCTISDSGFIVDQNFISLNQYKTYNTYEITSNELSGMPFELKNKGLHFSEVNVKLPAPTETWISLEPRIVELFNNENKNHAINIKFSYGKQITDEENDLVQNVADIESLISKDKIISVATEYINKQVSKTKSIPNEDKEKCAQYIIDTFVNEMSNFTADLNSNNIIKLNKLICNNFMSFGDGILIDFNDYNGLTKLVGGNGVGKTTMYNLLKWIITGFINNEQNATRKKENTLTIFNDYRYNVDKVYGCLMTNINSVELCIERIAVREWNKGVTEEQKKSERWKEYISSASTQIKITEVGGNMEVYENTVAENMLSGVFGGLENLERLLFVNQFSLLKFVCSEPARLCEEILTHIGMNFFDKMMSRYDDLRNEKMKSLAKPSLSIDEIIKRRNELITNNEVIINKSGDIATDYTALDMNLESYENDKKTLLTALNNVSEDDVKKMENELETQKTDHQNKVNMLTNSLLAANEIIASYDIENLNLLMDEYVTKNELIENNIAAFENELNNKNHEIELKKRDINDLALKIKQAINDEIVVIENSISKMNNEVLENKSKITELKSKRNAEINEYLLTKSKIITENEITLNNKINRLKEILNKISDHNNKITEYEKSTICPTCNRKLEEDSLQHIHTLITEIKNEIDVLNTELQKLQQETIEFKHNLDVIKNDYEEVKKTNSISTTHIFDSQIIELENSIKNIELNIIETRKQIAEKQESINSTIKNDPKFIEENNAYVELLSMIDPIKDKIAQCTTSLNEGIANLTNVCTKIESYNKINETVKNNTHGLELLATRKEIFDIMEQNIAEKKKQLEADIAIRVKLSEIEPHIISITETMNKLKEEDDKLLKQRTENEILITEYEKSITSAIEYRIAESSLKQYKALIGKQGLPQHIFSLIKPILNSKLNDLLEDMDFRLYFDENNYLQMLDLSKETRPVRQPMFISGMQVCFCALSLLYVNRMSNNMFIIKELFIDEVSGQLNDGQDLSYETLNYQEQLKKLLKRFTGMNIWIIDHVIEDMEEDNKIEVIPTKDGAKLNKLIK